MDPITRAARAFMREADAILRAGEPLRMIAGPSQRTNVVKALRVMELEPENRRPFFVHEAPFEAAEDYFNGLARKIRDDYEQIREGLAKDGVALPPFTLNEPDALKGSSLERAALHVERASTLLGDGFEGVLLALAPAKIASADAWRESVSALLRARWPPRVRLAFLDAEGGPLESILGAKGARFSVDPDELWAHLKEVSAAADEAASSKPLPPNAAEARRRFEQETGRKLPSPEGGKRLRALLLEAGEHTGKGRHEAAAEAYGKARALCQEEKLALEEAMILMGLAGLSLTMRLPDRAITCYQRAAEIGAEQGNPTLVCQAWMGVGGVKTMQKDYLPAIKAYESAATAAKEANVPALCIEALRMAGSCHVLRGARDGAIPPWQEAALVGSSLDPAHRRATTFKHVAEALVEQLRRRGMHPQAAHVQSLLDADKEA